VDQSRRHIWLCADDYGISHSVNAAIRTLIMCGRINATSVMVAAPHFDRGEAVSLRMLNSGTKRVALGLHVTLTAPFKPTGAGFAPTQDGCFLPLKETLRAALTRKFNHQQLVIEIATQLRAFLTAFGHLPDFVDGHQHVHLFPQVRDATLKVVADVAPKAWVRQCGRTNSLAQRLRNRKGLLLDVLSVRFRSNARRRGIATNPGFAGTYDFTPDADFARLFPHFLTGLPAGGLIMCHPGFVDAELKRLDSLTTLREREYEFLNGDEFPRVLAAHDVALMQPVGNAA
jgi:chitin disaccharide deacetylase